MTEYNVPAVAPLAGAWIEICVMPGTGMEEKSLPLRERGLKYGIDFIVPGVVVVAPLAGAWIEIV